MIERLFIGILISALVAIAGWRGKSLTGRGTVAAAGVGTAIIWGTSWAGAVLLGAFFLSSSALSKLTLVRSLGEKTSQRDARQVFANGGVAAIAALAALGSNGLIALAVVAGSIAAATSDTWATEIGSLSRDKPRFLVSRERAVPGESGAVTTLGLLAAAGGAMFLGILAAALAGLRFERSESLAVFAIVSVSGMTGSLFDSLAGEYLQSKRWCPLCMEIAESDRHSCGELTEKRSGIDWVDNDVVNVICTGSAAVLSLIAAWLLIDAG